MSNLTEEGIARIVANQVNEIFEAKEAEDQRENARVALEEAHKTIEELTSSIEAKDAEIASLIDQLEQAKVEPTGDTDEELAKEFESLKEQLSTLTVRAEKAEYTILALHNISVSLQRARELVDEGLAVNAEEAAAKVVNMTDEEFASYKDALGSMRTVLLENLKKLAEQATETSSEENSEEEAEEIPAPPDVSSGKESASIQTPLDLGDDVKEKFSKAGKAMAARMRKNRGAAEEE